MRSFAGIFVALLLSVTSACADQFRSPLASSLRAHAVEDGLGEFQLDHRNLESASDAIRLLEADGYVLVTVESSSDGSVNCGDTVLHTFKGKSVLTTARNLSPSIYMYSIELFVESDCSVSAALGYVASAIY